MKKIFSMVIVLCLLICSFSITVSAEPGDNYYYETEANDIANNYPDGATVLYKDFTIEGSLEDGATTGDVSQDYYSFELFEASKVTALCISEFETLVGCIIDAYTSKVLYDFYELTPEEGIYADGTIVTLPAGKYLVYLSDKHIDNYYEYDYILYFDYQNVEAELVYEDGKYYCLIDGEYTDFTGLININGKQHYIRNGCFLGATGLVTLNGKKMYINKGYFTGASGLVTIGGKKMYINKGYFTGASGLVTIGGKKMYINKGYFTGASGLVTIKGKKMYINKGYFTGASGLVTIKGKKMYINKGYFLGATGIVKIGSKRYYIKKGYAQLSFSGKVKISGKTYTIKKGIVK